MRAQLASVYWFARLRCAPWGLDWFSKFSLIYSPVAVVTELGLDSTMHEGDCENYRPWFRLTLCSNRCLGTFSHIVVVGMLRPTMTNGNQITGHYPTSKCTSTSTNLTLRDTFRNKARTNRAIQLFAAHVFIIWKTFALDIALELYGSRKRHVASWYIVRTVNAKTLTTRLYCGVAKGCNRQHRRKPSM